MDFYQEYNKMRPYNDSEVGDAIARLVKNKNIKDILSFLYPDRNAIELIGSFEKIKTVKEFQSFFSDYAVKEIIRRTSDGLTVSGIENLDSTKPYLFIANHRDIVLDSAIMQTVLIANHADTSQITFGDNLMSSNFIVDLGKLNKMFTFYRSGSKIQLYRNALLHANYIHHVITKEKQSVWIAQRDGRTKNGDDKTQIALIKMLTMGQTNAKTALMDLNIIPVVISYELEPCDAEKVNEVYQSQIGMYKKTEGEDLQSILNGIKGYKGRIHMAFGRPLNKALEENYTSIEPCVNEISNFVICELDEQFHKNYALWPFNYIAADILLENEEFANHKYTTIQKLEFTKYMNSKIESLQGDKKILTKLFLSIYATPVFNAKSIANIYKSHN